MFQEDDNDYAERPPTRMQESEAFDEDDVDAAGACANRDVNASDDMAEHARRTDALAVSDNNDSNSYATVEKSLFGQESMNQGAADEVNQESSAASKRPFRLTASQRRWVRMTDLFNSKYDCKKCRIKLRSKADELVHSKLKHRKKTAAAVTQELSSDLSSSKCSVSPQQLARSSSIEPKNCFSCSQTFPTYHRLTQHIMSQHLNERPYGCKLCKMSFIAFVNFKRHFQKYHSGVSRTSNSSISSSSASSVVSGSEHSAWSAHRSKRKGHARMFDFLELISPQVTEPAAAFDDSNVTQMEDQSSQESAARPKLKRNELVMFTKTKINLNRLDEYLSDLNKKKNMSDITNRKSAASDDATKQLMMRKQFTVKPKLKVQQRRESDEEAPALAVITQINCRKCSECNKRLVGDAEYLQHVFVNHMLPNEVLSKEQKFVRYVNEMRKACWICSSASKASSFLNVYDLGTSSQGQQHEFVARNEHELIEHIRSKHTFELPFRCSMCESPAYFTDFNSMRVHYRNHVIKPKKPMTGPTQLNFRYFSQNNDSSEMSSADEFHNDENRAKFNRELGHESFVFACYKCETCFSTYEEIISHFFQNDECNPSSDSEAWGCQECPRGPFTTQVSYNVHTNQHRLVRLLLNYSAYINSDYQKAPPLPSQNHDSLIKDQFIDVSKYESQSGDGPIVFRKTPIFNKPVSKPKKATLLPPSKSSKISFTIDSIINSDQKEAAPQTSSSEKEALNVTQGSVLASQIDFTRLLQAQKAAAVAAAGLNQKGNKKIDSIASKLVKMKRSDNPCSEGGSCSSSSSSISPLSQSSTSTSSSHASVISPFSFFSKLASNVHNSLQHSNLDELTRAKLLDLNNSKLSAIPDFKATINNELKARTSNVRSTASNLTHLAPKPLVEPKVPSNMAESKLSPFMNLGAAAAALISSKQPMTQPMAAATGISSDNPFLNDIARFRDNFAKALANITQQPVNNTFNSGVFEALFSNYSRALAGQMAASNTFSSTNALDIMFAKPADAVHKNTETKLSSHVSNPMGENSFMKAFEKARASFLSNQMQFHLQQQQQQQQNHQQARESENEIKPIKPSTSASAHAAANRCELCSCSFKTVHELSQHIQTHESRNPKRPYKCHLCQVTFAKTDQLVRHMIVHQASEMDSVCLICFSSFSRKQDLDRHMLFHSK